MNFKIKKILNEFAQQDVIKRIYNMIKDEFFLENGKVRTTIIDLDGRSIIPDSRSGLYIQLNKKNAFAERIVEHIQHSFGLSDTDAEKVYDLVSFNLKKDNFIDYIPEIVYEDFFSYTEQPFIIDMTKHSGEIQRKLDIRKVGDFMEFIKWYGLYSYDAHDDTKLSFEGHLTDEDYLYMQDGLIEKIEYNEGYN
jgi:hypothetical protein